MTVSVEGDAHAHRLEELGLPLPVVVVDGLGHIVAANDAARELLPKPKDLIGRLLIQYVEQESRRAVMRTLTTGTAPASTVLLRGGEGTVPVRLLSAPHDDGHISLVVVERTAEFAERERARHLAEELDQARASTAAGGEPGVEDVRRVRLARLFEEIHQGMVAVDVEGWARFANASARDLIGDVDPDARLPATWHGFDLAGFAHGLFEPDAVYAEATVDTGSRLIRLSGIPAADELALILATDISDRSRREAAERDFVTNAAHELLNPVAAIASATDALELAGDDPEAQRRFVEHLVREARRLDRLIRALLDLARIQHRAEPPQLAPLELRGFLEGIAELLSPGPDVQLQVLCPPELVVATNEGLLAHAVLNAATNAVRHTGAGVVRLTGMRVRRALVVDVDDSGAGIPLAERRRVLERFYRVEPRDQGAGLGLAIASHAVEALGGLLALTDSPLGGTKARIKLPPAETS